MIMEPNSVYNYKDIIFSCFQPEESLTEQRLPRHALVYVYSGEIQIEDNGKKQTVKAGEYVFLKRDSRLHLHKHTFGKDPYKAISVRFDRGFLREYFSKIKNKQLPEKVSRFKEAVIKLKDSPYIESLFTSLLPFTDKGIKPDDEFVDMKMAEAVRCLLQADERFYPTLFDFNAPWKIDLMEFMEQNYLQDLNMEEFAAYTGRSLASFKRDFSTVSELPPQKWLIKKRLEKAHNMLKERNHKISDLHLQVGFRNRSHFTTAFKNQYGYAPSEVMAV